MLAEIKYKQSVFQMKSLSMPIMIEREELRLTSNKVMYAEFRFSINDAEKKDGGEGAIIIKLKNL